MNMIMTAVTSGVKKNSMKDFSINFSWSACGQDGQVRWPRGTGDERR